jgi:type II secretory pathway component GspD/PulD (secretin)
MLILARRHTGYGQSIDFQTINTGFWVRPVLEGDYATLDIRPHLEGFKKNSSGVAGLPSSIELQELVTTVRIPLGQWVDLGGILRETDEISRGIVSWRAGNTREEKTVWLKVER